jgi:branched-chain amino acid transport system permease protein
VNWSLFFDLTVSGLTLGSVYALIALGYSMVYGILKLLNFAHGDVMMVGAFVGWGILTWLGGAQDPSVAVWLLITLMALGAMAACGGISLALERFAYRPLRTATRIAPLISALGASFFIQNTVLLLYGAQFRSYDAFDLVDPEVALDAGPLHVWAIRLVVIGSAFAMMAALTLLVARSRLGRAMRATAFDREGAAMMGIDVDRVIAATFVIGGVLAGAAGVLVGLVFGQINHFMGFNYGLKAFTAAVVGGIGSIPGAMLGGLMIGLAEAYTTGYLTSTFKDFIVFSLLITFLLIRPNGLLGRPEVKKV